MPLALFGILLADVVAKWIYRRFPDDERLPRLVATIAAIVILTGAWYQIGSMWSFAAEIYRLRNSHVSYRMYYVPWSRHPIVVLTCGASAFALVARTRYRRLAGDQPK